MWKPWEGARYQEKRTLLLGESCYDWEDEGTLYKPQVHHPSVIVGSAIDKPNKGSPTMKKLTRAICGCYSPTSKQATERWDEFAFTNYVPVSVGFGPSRRPSSSAWKQAKEEWKDLLNLLNPRTIVVFGITMWENMPETQVIINDYVQGYTLKNGGVAMCYATKHFAHGHSWSEYSRIITEAEQGRSVIVTQGRKRGVVAPT